MKRKQTPPPPKRSPRYLQSSGPGPAATPIRQQPVQRKFTMPPDGDHPAKLLAVRMVYVDMLGSNVLGQQTAPFIRDESGRVTHLVMYQNGRSRKVPRISD